MCCSVARIDSVILDHAPADTRYYPSRLGCLMDPAMQRLLLVSKVAPSPRKAGSRCGLHRVPSNLRDDLYSVSEGSMHSELRDTTECEIRGEQKEMDGAGLDRASRC